MNEKKLRKRRTDRRHLIYVLTNTVTLERYVGVTVSLDRSGKKSLEARWKRHVTRATNQDKSWNLCRSIREYGAESFTQEIIHFIRGKAPAFKLETELRKTGDFTLNTL